MSVLKTDQGEQSEEFASYCAACGAEVDHIEERRKRRCWPCLERYRPQWVVDRDRLWSVEQLTNRATAREEARA